MKNFDLEPKEIDDLLLSYKTPSKESFKEINASHNQNSFLYSSLNSQINNNKVRQIATTQSYHQKLSLPFNKTKQENFLSQIEEALLKPNPPIENLFNSLNDPFEVYYLEEMSKTTPNWKNSFASVRDRFGNDSASNYTNQQKTTQRNFLTNGNDEEERNAYTMSKNASKNEK